jgi:YVTN family beta-propeller protein
LKSNLSRLVLLLLSATFCNVFTLTSSAFAQEVHGFHIQQQWNIGGEGGWSHLVLDTPSHRLYIPRTDRVTIVNTETGKADGEVTGFVDALGLALDDQNKYGYVADITDGTAGFVRVFDRSNLKVIASIPVGRNPGTILYEPATKTVLAFSSHDHSASIIDAKTLQITGTLLLPARPASAIADGKGEVFVTLPALGEIDRIDVASDKITTSWPVAPCVGPSTLAIDTTHRQVFAACENHSIIAIDASNGSVSPVGESTIGRGELAFDAHSGMLAFAATSGKLMLFHQEAATQYKLQQDLATLPGAGTLVIDSQKKRIYLVTAKFGMRTGEKSEELQFRPTPVPGSFSVLVVGR